MLGSRSPLLSGPLKHRCHRRKFRKRAAELCAAAAVSGGSESLSVALDSLSVALGSLSVAPGSLSAAGLAGSGSEPAAAASPPSGNSVKNHIEFHNLS